MGFPRLVRQYLYFETVPTGIHKCHELEIRMLLENCIKIGHVKTSKYVELTHWPLWDVVVIFKYNFETHYTD